jgi:predicted TIM-barrel fold metal-dependent hydrolase
VQTPGNTAPLGEYRQQMRRGEPAPYRYADTLPAEHGDPSARLAFLDRAGLDEAVCFPNFGLLWERQLSSSLTAQKANMGAWNRWCATVVDQGQGRLHPVAHLTLRDPEWIEAQLATLAAAGVKLAMIAPAPVDGRSLADPAHDRIWSAFEDHDITAVFHVADQNRVFDDCWFEDGSDGSSLAQTVDSVFIWVPAALALTDLILHGVFDRHPRLRVGVVELSAVWLPMWQMMLDGGSAFIERLNGQPVSSLKLKPSEYLAAHVRISSFSYELPTRIMRHGGDILMCCSDFPHSEGTAQPVQDYERTGCVPADQPGLFADNVSFLLGR